MTPRASESETGDKLQGQINTSLAVWFLGSLQSCNFPYIKQLLDIALNLIIIYTNLASYWLSRLFPKHLHIMPNLEEFVEFDPEKDIPSLQGKVIFVTGGRFPRPGYITDNIADNL